jgi:2-oxoglutarate ferredoxin oxidoreductase subunit gamma
MRGGTAHCFVVLGDKPIGSPIVRNPKVALVFNNPSFDKYEPLVAAGGLLVVNASLVTDPAARSDIVELRVPATELASEVGNARLTNIIMLSAALALRPVVTVDALKHGLEHHIPAHRRDMLEMNMRAIDRGAAFAQSAIPVRIP